MKILTFAALALAISVVCAVVFYTIIAGYNTLDSQELPMKIEVATYVGLSVTNSTLDFGSVPGSGSARKNITITNSFDIPVVVRIKPTGVMYNWTGGYEPEFTLEPGQEKEFMLVVRVPPGTPMGMYNGTLSVLFTKH